MRKLRLIQIMMTAAIILIVGFQVYYVTKLYKSEWHDLKKETDVLFRETVYKLQVARFKKDTTFFTTKVRIDSVRMNTDNVFNLQAINVIRNQKKNAMLKLKDSAVNPKAVIISLPAEGVNRREISEHFRATIDSLMLNKSGKYQIITSSSAGGNHVRMFSKNIKDTVLANDSSIKIVFSEGRKNDVIVAPASKVIVLAKTRINVRDTNRRHSTDYFIKNKTLTLKSSFSDDPEIQVFANSGSANDSLSLPQVDSAFTNDLQKASINLPRPLLTDTPGDLSVTTES